MTPTSSSERLAQDCKTISELDYMPLVSTYNFDLDKLPNAMQARVDANIIDLNATAIVVCNSVP